MLLPVELPLDRLEKVLSRMRENPGAPPASMEPPRRSSAGRPQGRDELQGFQQGGQGGALGLVGGEQGVECGVLALQ